MLDGSLAALAVTSAIGFAMTYAGVRKNALEWRRGRRYCPSCGHDRRACRCTSA